MLKIIIFILLLFSPTIFWYSLPYKEYNAFILNKTVHSINTDKHKGIFWILNNKKYLKHNKEKYNYEKDYYGYHPLKNKDFEIKSLPSKIENYDLVYIADTYGIYQNDLREEKKYPNKLIYGGIVDTEGEKLIDAFKNKNKKVIFEFNTISTIKNQNLKNKISDLLGVKTTGWSAKYFNELDKDKNKELPEWAITNYEKQYNKKWNFKDSGILFAHEDGKLISIIEDKEKVGLNFFVTKEGNKQFKYDANTLYYDWFEIVKANKDSKVLSEFDLKRFVNKIDFNCNLKKLDNFPAIVFNTRNTTKTYYFSGEFSKIDNVPSTYQFWGMSKLRRLFTNNKSKESFFWNIFEPIIL